MLLLTERSVGFPSCMDTIANGYHKRFKMPIKGAEINMSDVITLKPKTPAAYGSPQPEAPGKRGACLRRAVAVVLLCLLASGLTACGAARPGNAGPQQEPREEAPLPVAVLAIAREDMARTLTLGGLLKPQEEVALMGGGAGSRILQIAVSVGDYVQKGQSILTQDMRDLEISEQNLRISRSQLQETLDNQKQTFKINKDQLQDTYDKTLALLEAGAATESQVTALENSIQQLDLQTESLFAGLENQIKQIDLQLATIRINREKMAVTSTIDGVISTLPVVEGQMAMASTVVATVVNIDKLLLDNIVIRLFHAVRNFGRKPKFCIHLLSNRLNRHMRYTDGNHIRNIVADKFQRNDGNRLVRRNDLCELRARFNPVQGRFYGCYALPCLAYKGHNLP